MELLFQDKRLKVTYLMTAFDMASRIINKSKNGESFFKDNGYQERHHLEISIQEQFKTDVFDAWGDILGLLTEMQCNTMVKTLVQLLEMLQDDEQTDVDFDEVKSQVANNRAVLNELLQADKDNVTELRLVKLMDGMSHLKDPDQVNSISREAVLQADQLMATQASTEALKSVYDVFQIAIDQPEVMQSDAVVQSFTNWGDFVVRSESQQKLQDTHDEWGMITLTLTLTLTQDTLDEWEMMAPEIDEAEMEDLGLDGDDLAACLDLLDDLDEQNEEEDV